MHVIVLGAGAVGFDTAERLSKEGHRVTVIEKNLTKARTIKAKLNALVVHGSGASAEILDQAGVAAADLFIAAADQDEVNLAACLLASERGTRRIITRIKNVEYAGAEWARSAAKLGIDVLVNPHTVVAEEICRLVNLLIESETSPCRTVFVLGGDRIGAMLARNLIDLRLRVKLIESDPQLCERLAEQLGDAVVLNTEGTDVDVLKHEGISACDVYVAVTGNEHSNILCSLLAKISGAKRAIALVDRFELVALAPSLGVDACVSARQTTAAAILRGV